MIIVGLDLAGSEKRQTGFCLMNERSNCSTAILQGDDEVVSKTIGSSPHVVSIDAPLFLPKGRRSLEDRGPPHLRECDKQLLRMKIKFFPVSLGPMRKLTERGIRLRGFFEAKGLAVIESFPGAVQDVLGMPRKQDGLEELRAALIAYGARGDVGKKDITHDELDAITCALMGKMYLEGDFLKIGDPDEGYMILPKPASRYRASKLRQPEGQSS